MISACEVKGTIRALTAQFGAQNPDAFDSDFSHVPITSDVSIAADRRGLLPWGRDTRGIAAVRGLPVRHAPASDASAAVVASCSG
jgi:hypothetical protein